MVERVKKRKEADGLRSGSILLSCRCLTFNKFLPPPLPHTTSTSRHLSSLAFTRLIHRCFLVPPLVGAPLVPNGPGRLASVGLVGNRISAEKKAAELANAGRFKATKAAKEAAECAKLERFKEAWAETERAPKVAGMLANIERLKALAKAERAAKLANIGRYKAVAQAHKSAKKQGKLKTTTGGK